MEARTRDYDCEVETSDTKMDDAETSDAEEDILGTEHENGDVQTRDGNVGRIESTSTSKSAGSFYNSLRSF